MSHLPVRLALPLLLAAVACAPADPDRGGDVRVRVGRVVVDARSPSPVIIREVVDGERALPIWIGAAEADAIHRRLENLPSLRPDSHDLATRLIEQLDASVEHVVVTRLSQGVFYARLVLRRAGSRLEIDSRPSDAIAIALRSDAPLFVREAVFDSAARGGDSHEDDEHPEHRERPRRTI